MQRDEESAINDRDSNIRSGSFPLKPELLTLQKTGTSHFALTWIILTIDSGTIAIYNRARARLDLDLDPPSRAVGSRAQVIY